MNYEFAIKKDVLKSGKVIFTPVCREKSRLPLIFVNKWNRIVKIYEKYQIQDLDFNPDLTYKECEEHILGYQEVLRQMVQNDVLTVEFHTLEQREI